MDFAQKIKPYTMSHILPYILHFAFLQSLVATLASIYIGEILKFYPCELCWYQRITMFPVPVILGIALYRHDKNAHFYALPFAVVGALIALYHTILYYKTPVEQAYSCALGESCTTRFTGIFSILPIPLLSLVAFGLISVCLVYLAYQSQKGKIA
jgi:disulfide bond formation protein DsbB